MRNAYIVGLALIAAGPLAIPLAAPAAAQASSYTVGDYWDMAGIDIDDGYSEVYADHLAGLWKKSQEYAKKQGWIDEYHVFLNAYPREGEPDIYLVTKFKSFPDAAETARRDKAYEAYMQKDARKMATESGERAKYRKSSGNMLFQELLLK